MLCLLVHNLSNKTHKKLQQLSLKCTELQDFSNQVSNNPDTDNLCINHHQWCINNQCNKVQPSSVLIMIMEMDLHVNFVELTQDKFQEEKQDVLLFYGVFVYFGQQVSYAAFHAVWTDAKIPNQSAQNVTKLKTQFQPIAADLYQYFINFIFQNFDDFLDKQFQFGAISSIQWIQLSTYNIYKQYRTNINLLFMNLTFSTTNRRQCYTCVSKSRNNRPNLSPQHEQSFFHGQILLNTAKILKGNKKNLKQHLRNQTLKSRSSNSKKNTNKSKSYFNSLAITADTTPRQMNILNSDLNLTLNHQKQEKNQTIQSKKTESKSQTYFKQKMKTLTQNFCRKQFRKLRNYQQTKDKNNRVILKQEIDDLSFRESAFSKELVNYQNDQNRKPISLKPNTTKISANSFQSTNLQSRMNQYMNVLIQKSEKDQLNILQAILSQRKDQQLQQMKIKEQKLMQKIKQKNSVFCKKIKMSNKNRLLKKTISRNIQQNKKSIDRQSISPKYKSIDITWRDMIEENKTSQLTKSILKMHKSNQFYQQASPYKTNFMHNNFLRSLIDKKRFDLQI